MRPHDSNAPLKQSADLNPYVILVAEDHPNGLKTVRVTLEKAGYTVLEARDGRSALERMAHHPDLVILDLALPDVDGFELIQVIRGLPGGAEIPVIAYSGFMTRLEEARSIEVGFTDYLFKPIVPARLLDTIEAYLPPKGNHQPVGIGQRLIVVDDDPTHLNLVGARLTRAGFSVLPISDATEALVRAHEFLPDLILADVLMPKMDGFQFCLAVRGDPTLAHVPVVLFSSAYNKEIDRQLAREAGANALVLKSPGFEAIIKAVGSSLGVAPPQPTARSSGLGEDYTRRLTQQLDREMLLNANIRQRLMRREAELAVLSTIMDALKHGSVEEILEEMLNRIVHVVGVSRGIIYLIGLDGTFLPQIHTGYPTSVHRGLGDFFGHADVLHRVIEEKAPIVLSLSMPRELLSRTDQVEQSVLIAPIHQGDECQGVLVMSSGRRVFNEEMLPFAKTVGAQIGQAMSMVKALATVDRETNQRSYAPH